MMPDGNEIYFGRVVGNNTAVAIVVTRFVDGAYTEPELLGPEVNSGQSRYNAFVAPDESYLIVPVVGREDSLGGTDYYIVYRDENDRWSEPVHMGDQVNSPAGQEWSAYVSPDREVLFFMSNRIPDDEADAQLTYADLRRRHNEPRNGNPDIYWVSAEIIDTLRPDGF